MDITFELLRAKLTVLGTSSSWPHRDDCFKVQIEDRGATYTNHYMPKETYRLWETLVRVTAGMAEADVKELLERIEEFGSRRWTEGSDNESMSNAGPDL